MKSKNNFENKLDSILLITHSVNLTHDVKSSRELSEMQFASKQSTSSLEKLQEKIIFQVLLQQLFLIKERLRHNQ